MMSGQTDPRTLSGRKSLLPISEVDHSKLITEEVSQKGAVIIYLLSYNKTYKVICIEVFPLDVCQLPVISYLALNNSLHTKKIL